LLHYSPKMKVPEAVDFREKAPLKAYEKMYLDKNGNEMKRKSLVGVDAVGVPGLVAGVLEIHQKYGKLPLKEVMGPAIDLAEKGFPVYPELAFALKYKEKDLNKFDSSVAIFFNKGAPLKEGELLQQIDLGKTLRLIALKGREGFYKGVVANSISEVSKKLGRNFISQKDFDIYNVKYRKPVKGEFRGNTIYSMSPPSSGGVHIIQILNILSNIDLRSLGASKAHAIHYVSSAMQAAFADRAEYLGDADFTNVPVNGLISPKYAKKLFNEISSTKALNKSDRSFGNPFLFDKDQTTHFSIMDIEGNAISSTQTINGYFGSSVVAPGTGIVLNNEMDDFATKVGASNLFGAVGGKNNLIEAQKRPLSSMSPTIIFDQQFKPKLVVGTPSGTRILTCVMQTILNYIEFEMPLYDAVAALRYHHQWSPDYIRVEDYGFSEDVEQDLASMGHDIKKKNLGCRIQAVAKEKGLLIGVSDPRGEGMSSGL
jgi:gamma-glutamyltranspeptidase / glutathione hydrolase